MQRAGAAFCVIVAVVAAGFAFRGSLFLPFKDQVIAVSADDQEMNAAIAKARSSLPKFWAHLSKPLADEDYFSLKLQLKDGSHSEHFWCDNIVGNENSATCIIGNDPETVKTVKLGDRVVVDRDKISDWMIRKHSKIFGGATIRPLLPKMDKSEAAALRATLSDEELH